jgi:hypothetical protein
MSLKQCAAVVKLGHQRVPIVEITAQVRPHPAGEVLSGVCGVFDAVGAGAGADGI